MIKIGEFSKLVQVPVATLRYYDQVGLLKPIEVDRFTSYRYYSVSQLPRLHRILALKGLGFSLEQIGVVLNEGLTPEQIRKARVLLWKGHCSVHQMFQPQHILRFRNQYPDGKVISHPECSFEVCKNSDYVGSTEYIIKIIRAAEPGTRWLVGTELNLVSRIAEEFKPEGKIIQFMASTICMCSTMARIDPQHLAWALENLVAGKVVNRIKVPKAEASLAKLALERMLEVSP